MEPKNVLLFLFYVLPIQLSIIELTRSEKILVLLPVASKSHKNVFSPLVSALAQRSHDLTVVSPFAPSKPQKNVRELTPLTFKPENAPNRFTARAESGIKQIFNSSTMILEGCKEVYQNEEFMTLVENEKFDLVLFNAFVNDCFGGVLFKLGAPFIMVTAQAAPPFVTIHAGNRLPPSFVPTTLLPLSDSMTFFQRVKNLLMNEMMGQLFTYFFLGTQSVYHEVMGPGMPEVTEIYSNVSMIFMNSHFTLTYPRPTLPDVVEVGGMHCRPAEPLPQDLEEYISGARDGAIFFSLGSIVQAKDMSDEMRKIFLNVFSRLKQRVLWKWETGEMPDLPPNVKLIKWAPQQDILGHPNVKLFMSHGGLLSTQEATYHGVPLLGIPLFADQDLNTQQAERAGYALTLEILDLTEEILKQKLNRLLTENEFTEKAKELSSLFRDQPQTPLERAVFWSEYVMRHKGAKHMRSAARKLNFFQYYSIDVLVTLLFGILIVLWVTKKIIVTVFRKVCGKQTQDKKKKKQ